MGPDGEGDPELYWEAFFESVVQTRTAFDAIFVNPNHRGTSANWPKFAESRGEEFDHLLKMKIRYYEDSLRGNDLIAADKLKSIVNLREQKTDLIQLQRNLIKLYPNKIISLVNDSDPDVTFGNNVGMNTLHQPHTNTTEENYAALGSLLINFEAVTKVHQKPERIFQVEGIGGVAKATLISSQNSISKFFFG